MSFRDERKALTREKRVSTLSHFNGTIETLLDETGGSTIHQRIRTFSQGGYDEIISVLSVLLQIRDAAVIVHGAAGCSSAALAFAEHGSSWYSTGLNERDTILGGDEKLRGTVLRAFEEQRPKAIFIVGTPVVAINNDDVNAAILELSEEINVPLISVYTDGFKSKTAVNGYDILSHCFLKYLVDPEPPEKEAVLNIISYSETKADLMAILPLLKTLGIPYRVLPRFGTIETLRIASHAKATVALNPDEGGYFATGLEEVFGVPYLRLAPPVGIRNTRKFLKKIAEEFACTAQADLLIEEKEAEAEEVLADKSLTGRKVFLDFPLPYLAGLLEITDALGGTVSGAAVPFVDIENRYLLPRLSFQQAGTTFFVGSGQPFEKANLLFKNPPDFYFGAATDVGFAAGFGSIPVSFRNRALFGYDGIREICRATKEPAYVRPVDPEERYTPAWLKRSGSWYVKMEEK